MNDFSYEYYIHLIQTMMQVMPLMDYSQVKPSDDSFFILRHDVEFSVEKAYELARVEHDILGVKSSYFFQVRNYAYNPLAYKNSELIKKIHRMGHRIGLHVNRGESTHPDELSELIKKDVSILQTVLSLPVDRFSFHRPLHSMLEENIKIEGLINAYDPLYFHFYNHELPSCLKVYYFSDSEHQWKYGRPLSALGFVDIESFEPAVKHQEPMKKQAKKVQLLTHPYSWSIQGLNNNLNFKALIQEKQDQMLHSMQDECRNFPNELLKNDKI